MQLAAFLSFLPSFVHLLSRRVPMVLRLRAVERGPSEGARSGSTEQCGCPARFPPLHPLLPPPYNDLLLRLTPWLSDSFRVSL